MNLVHYKYRLKIYSHFEITYTVDYLQGKRMQSNTKASRRLESCQGLNYINSLKSAHSIKLWQYYAGKTNKPTVLTLALASSCMTLSTHGQGKRHLSIPLSRGRVWSCCPRSTTKGLLGQHPNVTTQQGYKDYVFLLYFKLNLPHFSYCSPPTPPSFPNCYMEIKQMFYRNQSIPSLCFSQTSSPIAGSLTGSRRTAMVCRNYITAF